MDIAKIEAEISKLEPVVGQVVADLDPALAPTVAVADAAISGLEGLLGTLNTAKAAVDPAQWSAQVAAGKEADAAIAAVDAAAPKA